MVDYIGASMDLSKYNQLEQLSKDELDHLKRSIINVVGEDWTIDHIFVVGSFVFGLDKANDIDVVVCVPRDEYAVNLDDVDEEVLRMFDTLYSQKITELVGKQVSLQPNNIRQFLTDPQKEVDPPMYDLISNEWLNKVPGGKWNYYMLRDGLKCWIVERDSEEGRWITINWKNTNTEWTQYRLDNGEEVWDIGGNKIVKFDQFFSAPETVDEILGTFEECINDLGIDLTQYTYIEPSAGDACILERLPKERRIGIDIEPRHDEVISSDFLEWLPGDDKKYITLGNPPFGVRGDMIVKFVRHASKFSDVIGLGVPDYFKMDVDGMEMVCNKQLSDNKYRLVDGTETSIPIRMHFQVWVKTNMHERMINHIQV